MTRGDCQGGPRPHAFCARCPYRLGAGPDPDVCVLDVADRGPHTLEQVGALFGFTRERARQVQAGAFAKLSVAIRNGGQHPRPARGELRVRILAMKGARICDVVRALGCSSTYVDQVRRRARDAAHR